MGRNLSNEMHLEYLNIIYMIKIHFILGPHVILVSFLQSKRMKEIANTLKLCQLKNENTIRMFAVWKTHENHMNMNIYTFWHVIAIKRHFMNANFWERRPQQSLACFFEMAMNRSYIYSYMYTKNTIMLLLSCMRMYFFFVVVGKKRSIE